MRAKIILQCLRSFGRVNAAKGRGLFFVCLFLTLLHGRPACGQTAPAILTQPQSRVVVAGSNLTVSVTVTGAPAPVLQWRCNGTNLVGANAFSLTLTNMSVAQSGNYDVIANNASGSVTSSVARLFAISITKTWTGGGDGQSWSDANNWSGGTLPSSADSIFIGSGNGTITNIPVGLTVNSLVCLRALAITSSFTATGAVDVVSNLYCASGFSLTASGANSAFIGEGSTTADGVSMYADSGGLISLPGLSSIYNPNSGSTIRLDANPGSVLDLSSVRQMSTVDNGTGIQVDPYAGAMVNFSGLTNISSGEILFYADATNGVINLDSLQTFSGNSVLEAIYGGIILATNLSSISGVYLYLGANSTMALGRLNSISNTRSGTTITLNAYSGTVLDLSSVRQMSTVDNVTCIEVNSYAGALVNLSGLTNISIGEILFYADATNGVINLDSLQTFRVRLKKEIGGVLAESDGQINAQNT